MDGRREMDLMRLLKVMRATPITHNMDSSWNPMKEDYENQAYKSYNRGPASGLRAGRAGPTRKHRLFVGGIPREMTNSGLENLFSTAATVTDCYVRSSDRPTTYGFVNVSSVKEVENAIKKLDGYRLKDHCIKVSVAREGGPPPPENLNRDGGRPQPGPHGDAHGSKNLSTSQSPPSSLNNGDSLESNGRSVDETFKSQGTPAQQISPMSSMVTAGCQECQRLLTALLTHMQQTHSQGAGQEMTSANATSPTLVNGNVPYNGPSRVHRLDSQQQGNRSSRDQSATDAGQPQSFQQSPRGSAFCKPSPKSKSPGVGKPVPVPMPKQQASQNNADVPASPRAIKTPERKRSETEPIKPCEACEKPGNKHCSKCGITYCSPACQKADWKKHKNKCKPNQSSELRDATAQPLDQPARTSSLKYIEPSQKEMKAVLTHINNPGSFWVQVGEEKNVKHYTEMLELIMRHVQATGPPQDPKPAMLCIAKYAVDDSWYRAQVQTVGKDKMCTVIMIDFGNSEEVSFTDLRPVTAEILDFPVFGVHCAIAGVEPRGKNVTWSPDSVKLMENLTRQVQLSTIRFEGKKAGIYQVALIIEDEKSGTISVGDALIKKELAWPKGSQPSATPKKALMRSSLKHIEIPAAGETVKIAINNYVSPREMQCQMITPESMKSSTELQAALNACLEGKPQQSGFTPQLGEVCAGRFTHDDQWYRVSIQSAKMDDGGYLVEYIDFGNSEVLPSARMYPLPPQFHNVPQQSFVASFAGLPSGDISLEQSKTTMQRLSQCKEGYFLATIVEKKNDLIYIDLQDPDTKEDIAEAAGLVVKVKGHRVADMTFRTIQPNVDTEFVITEAVSPGEFYGFSPSETESTKLLGHFTEGSREVSSQAVVPEFRPTVGELCWAQFSVDKDWYRAAVLKEHPNDEFDVQYIDYGNGEKVHLSVMRPITDNMAAVPVLAIRCCIAGLPNYDGPWSKEVTDSLKEMAGVGNKKIIVRAMEHRKNVTYVVLEDPETGLNISQEIINLVKESSGAANPPLVSGPSSLTSHPSLDDPRMRQQRQPSTPQQPRSAPAAAVSPEQLKSLEEQLALIQAQLQQAKGFSN